jgi:Flp pilus assembly protein TadB
VVESRPRNPFRSEADAFRLLLICMAAAAAVIAVALLVSSLAGALLGLVLVGVGLWRAWGLLQRWRREGSEPS